MYSYYTFHPYTLHYCGENFYLQNHVLPEKAGDLINAHVRFLKYEQDAPTNEEKRIAKKLRKLFEKKDYGENPNIYV